MCTSSVPPLLADVGVGGPAPGGAPRRRAAVTGGVLLPRTLVTVPRPVPIAGPRPRRGSPVTAGSAIAGQAAVLTALTDPPAARREVYRLPTAYRRSRSEAERERGESSPPWALLPRVRLRRAESPVYSLPDVPDAVVPDRIAGA